MSSEHDKNIRETMTNRYRYASEACTSGDLDTFVYCQNVYFNFFTSRSLEELKEMLTIIPKGSIIFHGTPCKTTRDYPSARPYVRGSKLSGIQHVLSEETIQKTIGTISFKMKEAIEAEPDESEHDEIRAKFSKEVSEYRDRINDAMGKGISVGKSFFWANTTVDANVMVDVRLMKSMTMFIAKRDIVLLNYFKVFKIMEQDLATRTQKYVTYLISSPPVPGSMDAQILKKLLALFDMDELAELVKDKNELIDQIKILAPKMYHYLWSVLPPIFKRAMAMPKEITQDKDVEDEYATGRWTDVVSLDDKIQVILRNKYKDTIGDSTFIQLLNYILGFKGNYRISGYADYDPADKTLSDILAGTNICGPLGDGSQVCKEIMMLDPSKYLTYLGYCEITPFDTKAADATDMLNAGKLSLWTKISTKLNSLIKKESSTFTKIKWVTEPEEFDPMMFGDTGIYKNIAIFPHYRFDGLSISQIDNLVANIEDTDLNLISINDRRISHTILGPYKPPMYQVGGADPDGDGDDTDVEMAHILSQLKLLSPNSSGHVYSPEVYLALYKYVESMNPAIVEDDESTEMTDEMRDQKKYKIKTDISDVVTKTLHKNAEVHQACIDELGRICETVRTDLSTKTAKIQKMYDALDGAEFSGIRDGSEPIFFFYLKGSSALDLLVTYDKTYVAAIKASPQLSALCKKSDLKNSDFDINVCINPKIMKSRKRNLIKNMIVSYFSSLLQRARDTMVSTVFTLEKIRELFATVNKTLLLQAHESEVDPINVVVGDMHYAFEKFEKDDVIIQNKKLTIENSPVGVVKISHIEIADTKLNSFSLLRLKVTGSSGKQHLNCHGELLDVSVIDDLDEAEFTWPHHDDVLIINGIFVNDLKGLCLDLNNTLLNNLVMINKNKSMKRFIRLEFVHKLLCTTLEPSDEFFTRIRDVVHEKLPKKAYCAFDNNIGNLVNAIRLLAQGGDVSDVQPPDVGFEDNEEEPVPEPLLEMGREIGSNTELENLDTSEVIKAANNLLAEPQDEAEIIHVAPSKKIDKPLPEHFIVKPLPKKPSEAEETPEIPEPALPDSKSSPEAQSLKDTIKKLETLKSNRKKRNLGKKLESRIRNTLSALNRYESTDIRRSIKKFVSLKPTSTPRDRYYLMYLMFAVMYGQLDANNKILTAPTIKLKTTEDYVKLRAVYDVVAKMIGSVGDKVIRMFGKYDKNIMYTRYLNQPLNIISTFSNKKIKIGHKIQSILNNTKFRTDLADIIKFTLKLDTKPKIFRKMSNIEEMKIEGWGDNFIRVTTTYFVVLHQINIQLFNYQIILDTTSADDIPHSNVWRHASSVPLKGGRGRIDDVPIIIAPPDDRDISQNRSGKGTGSSDFSTFSESDLLKLPSARRSKPSIVSSNISTLPSENLSGKESLRPETTEKTTSEIVVTVQEKDVDFGELYEPTMQDACDALALFFPLEIPETIQESVHMILLGDFLSAIPGILDNTDSDSDEYLDSIPVPAPVSVPVSGGSRSFEKSTIMSMYTNNKKAYQTLMCMN